MECTYLPNLQWRPIAKGNLIRVSELIDGKFAGNNFGNKSNPPIVDNLEYKNKIPKETTL